MKEITDKKIVLRVSRVSIWVNLFLSAAKFAAGIFSNSSAMISDAVHSASDVFSTFIVIIGFAAASKKADKEHPYGHERMECVASIILAVTLLITGMEIGKSAIDKILSGDTNKILIPGVFALTTAVASIIVKELLYQYTIFYAKKINSCALKADAWHHRSDALSSIGALIGIVGARLGFPIFEPIASIVICLFIFKSTFDIFKDAVDKMIDKSCEDGIVSEMYDIIEAESGVESLVSLKTRMFGSKAYVDAVIMVDGRVPLTEAHRIAENVHDTIEKCFPMVKHCMVHVDPKENPSDFLK